PGYMVPSVFVELDELPHTPHGKIDLRALPKPELQQSGAGEGVELPRTVVEEVGVEENFFELGGHSLLATQMVSRVRQAFRTEVQLRWVFESPTVAGLSRRIEEQQRAGIGVRAGAIERALRDGDLALSFAQERLWFIEQMEPGRSTYNIPAG